MMTRHVAPCRRFAPRICGFALLLGVAAAAAALPGLPAAAAEPRCSREAEAHLTALGIERGDIEALDIIRILGSQEMGNVAEYQAWARLRSCAGSVVVRMRFSCGVIDSYARGTCSGQVPGLR